MGQLILANAQFEQKHLDTDSRFEVFLNANGAGGFRPPAPKMANMLSFRLRLDRDFDDPVQTIAEQLVGVDDLV
jgi:hypothetical protein